MMRNHILSAKQYGFVGRSFNRPSTDDRLRGVIETDILDSGGEFDVIYMDFVKAFGSASTGETQLE